MLTKKQHDLLLFIHKTAKERGIAPSFDEMKEEMGFKSKASVHRLVSQLEKRRFLKRRATCARALEVTVLPEEKALKIKPVSHDALQTIPLCGKIAAGLPIEAVNTAEESICVPQEMTGKGEYYALLVEGDSMKDAGILDGDTVIIRSTGNDAPNGSIVVALVDGYEVTLKRLYKKGRTVALEPANAAYETRIFEADRVEVQGVLAGLMRHY